MKVLDKTTTQAHHSPCERTLHSHFSLWHGWRSDTAGVGTFPVGLSGTFFFAFFFVCYCALCRFITEITMCNIWLCEIVFCFCFSKKTHTHKNKYGVLHYSLKYLMKVLMSVEEMGWRYANAPISTCKWQLCGIFEKDPKLPFTYGAQLLLILLLLMPWLMFKTGKLRLTKEQQIFQNFPNTKILLNKKSFLTSQSLPNWSSSASHSECYHVNMDMERN